ncbi:MAG: hypothetical protein AAB019_07050 [Planctomycetota bacterium]
MIKNPKKYREESEKERAEYLRNLTYEQSARIMEMFITSRFGLELNFSKEPPPYNLINYIKVKRCRK